MVVHALQPASYRLRVGTVGERGPDGCKHRCSINAPPEQHVIDRLLAAWRRIVEGNLFVR